MTKRHQGREVTRGAGEQDVGESPWRKQGHGKVVFMQLEVALAAAGDRGRGVGWRRRCCRGFEATTSLDEMLDEVIPWIAAAIENGTI